MTTEDFTRIDSGESISDFYARQGSKIRAIGEISNALVALAKWETSERLDDRLRLYLRSTLRFFGSPESRAYFSASYESMTQRYSMALDDKYTEHIASVLSRIEEGQSPPEGDIERVRGILLSLSDCIDFAEAEKAYLNGR